MLRCNRSVVATRPGVSRLRITWWTRLLGSSVLAGSLAWSGITAPACANILLIAPAGHRVSASPTALGAGSIDQQSATQTRGRIVSNAGRWATRWALRETVRATQAVPVDLAEPTSRIRLLPSRHLRSA